MRRTVIIVMENVADPLSKSTQSYRGDAPRAAEHARGFEFHPDQVSEDQPDGSLVIRLRAAGRTEMAWHLYQWGDTVKVIEPKELRAMVEGYRRDDFYPVLPTVFRLGSRARLHAPPQTNLGLPHGRGRR